MINKRKDYLQEIMSPIMDDLSTFEIEYDRAIKSDVRLINSIAKYMIRNRGKNIRPSLTILSARLCGEPTINTYRAAAMMELLHVATLIHDDVVDEATLRRGMPSLNFVWKNKLSVLMGDFLLSKALINMIRLKDFEALERISITAEKLSAGEILQIEKSITRSMDEDTYFDMISQKTASLIATSCELGAITTTKNNIDIKSTYNFGYNLGIAFQIKDDLFDIVGSENDTGKNGNNDVKSNMITLPIIYAEANMSRSEKRQLNKLLSIKRKNKKNLSDILGLVTDAGGIEYSIKKMNEYSELAKDAISHYPDSIIKDSLIKIITFNVSRVK
ncbi:MAG: polyprenyl synthetase [Candidatus Marinimicrobia bacterium]|nr:polyprenyl synthetase [Candidatus Neomarinimicrobiota bacterium]